MAEEIGTNKSICILTTVVVCFAILWPGIFYPMLKDSLSHPDETGCCDIFLEKDLNTLNLMAELCENVLKSSHRNFDDISAKKNGKLNKTVITACRSIVLDTCLVDINILLTDRIQFGSNYRSILEEMRTINKSLCLKYNFGIDLKLIGVPHRVKDIFNVSISDHLKPERRILPKPETIHPALREKGRAIPHSREVSKVKTDHKVISSAIAHHFEVPSAIRRPPIPAMRPPMGAGMHAPVQPKGSGLLGILMPIYTVGIVVFFAYTIFKLMNKKNRENTNPDFDANEASTEFKKAVLENITRYNKISEQQRTPDLPNGSGPTSNFVVSAFSGLLEEVNRELDSKKSMSSISEIDTDQLKEDDIIAQSDQNNFKKSNGTAKGVNNDSDEKVLESRVKREQSCNGAVKVIGMETTKGSDGSKQDEDSFLTKEMERFVNEDYDISTITEQAQSITLPGKLQSDSRILVNDTYTELVPGTSIVESKVTLSVISPMMQAKQENENTITEEVTSIKDYGSENDEDESNNLMEENNIDDYDEDETDNTNDTNEINSPHEENELNAKNDENTTDDFDEEIVHNLVQDGISNQNNSYDDKLFQDKELSDFKSVNENVNGYTSQISHESKNEE